MLSWYAAAGYGALGGLIVEALVAWGRLRAWQTARHEALVAHKTGPDLGQYIDLGPDLLVAVTRAVLGFAAGLLLHGELTGIYAAVAAGMAAPGLLTQLPRSANQESRVDDAIRDTTAAASSEPAE